MDKRNSFNNHQNNNDDLTKKQKLKRFIKITVITLSVIAIGVTIFYFVKNPAVPAKILQESSIIIRDK